MKRHRRKRPKTRSIAGAFIFITIIALLIASIIKLDKAVRPSAKLQAEEVAHHTVSTVISESVSRYITENEYSYCDFAAVLYDESGRAASVEALSGNINRVQAELTAEINRQLNLSENAEARIRLGSLSGSYLFAGKGPSVKVKICPVGTAEVRLGSTFDSAGINQTRHRIYADISAEMTSSTTMYSFDTTVNFEYLLAETIIIGDVPEYSVRAWNELQGS